MDERDLQPPDKQNSPLKATRTKSPKKAEKRFLGVKQSERMDATQSPSKRNAVPKGEDPKPGPVKTESWPEYAVWQPTMTKQVKQEPLSPVELNECVQYNATRAQVSIENEDNLMSKPSRSPSLLATTPVRRIEAKNALSEPELLIPSSVAELQNMIFTDGLKGVLNLIQQQAQLIQAYGQQNLTSQDTQGTSQIRPTSMEKFQHRSAKRKSLYKTTAPKVAQTKPIQGTSDA